MLGEYGLVMSHVSPKLIAQIVDFIEARRFSSNLLASNIRLSAQGIERIALNEDSWKGAIWMAHHGRIRLI